MMLPAMGARSPLFVLTVAGGFVLLFIFGFFAWQSPYTLTHTSQTGIAQTTPAPLNGINDIIKALYADLKTAPDAPTFPVLGGEDLKLPSKPRYKTPMGKDVLIIDLDTRPLESTEAYEKGEYDWRKINHVSGGVFNHYTYAQVHGYDYKFVHASNFEDRHATWIKPSALANELKKHKWIVFLDADAAFRFLHLPIEWMFNYWKIEPHHSITMALDPWTPEEPQYNSDRFNRTYTNTGFMVVQNNTQTMEILKAWHECPSDVRYPNCSDWKTPKFHEQSAFGEYVRYDYEKNIKELPCAEANGYPGVQISNCQGKFIRHYWFDKSLVKKDFRENIMQAITLPIQEIFAKKIGGVVVQTDKNEIH